MMEKFEILLSCMHQSDLSIVEKSNIKSSVLIINQCNDNKISLHENARMISTTERGLSNSRNMAILNSTGDICLLSDDDEVFSEKVEDAVIEAYNRNPKADVIIFKISNFKEKYKFRGDVKKLGKLDLLKVSSQQISFRRKSIIENDIWFDTNLGAGTKNGAGEENDFLRRCLCKGLKIFYVPIEIAYVKEDSSSTWFKGFNNDFFYKRGCTLRYTYGFCFASLYSIYYLVAKHSMYKETITFWEALISNCRGIIDNKIRKERMNE